MQIAPVVALRLKSKDLWISILDPLLHVRDYRELILVVSQEDWAASKAFFWQVWCIYGSQGTELDMPPATGQGPHSEPQSPPWGQQIGSSKLDKWEFLFESQGGKNIIGSIWNTDDFPRFLQICLAFIKQIKSLFSSM